MGCEGKAGLTPASLNNRANGNRSQQPVYGDVAQRNERPAFTQEYGRSLVQIQPSLPVSVQASCIGASAPCWWPEVGHLGYVSAESGLFYLWSDWLSG